MLSNTNGHLLQETAWKRDEASAAVSTDQSARSAVLLKKIHSYQLDVSPSGHHSMGVSRIYQHFLLLHSLFTLSRYLFDKGQE